jgi:hypothetical protein
LTRATHDRIFCATTRVGDRIELFQAPVARAATVASVALAEILDERAMAAARARRVSLHVAQQRPRAVAPLAVRLQHLTPAGEIAARINQHALGAEAVAARASGFLLIVLERSRRARVHDEADVRSIDAHAECDGGDNDVRTLLEERLLIPAPHVVVEPP